MQAGTCYPAVYELPVFGEVNAEAPHVAELVVPGVEPRFARQAADLRQRAREGIVDLERGGCGIGVGAADRLQDDLVDDPGLEEIGRGQLQRLRGLDLLRGIAPEDR